MSSVRMDQLDQRLHPPENERRANAHIPIAIPLKIRARDGQQNRLQTIMGETQDMSEGGAGIIVLGEIPLSEDVIIEFDFSTLCPHFEIPFDIRWRRQEDTYLQVRYGISFSTHSGAKRQALRSILNRYQLDENRKGKLYMMPRMKGVQDPAHHAGILKNWLEGLCDCRFDRLSEYSLEPTTIQRNIENFIGVTQIPVGVGGPIKINGQYANGDYYVPFATTEGTLVETYHYGMLALSYSGGVNTYIANDRMDITPSFLLNNLSETLQFTSWVENHFEDIKSQAESTTLHGKLLDITPIILGRRVLLKFSFYTGDAMGMNIANIAADKASRYIAEQFGVKKFYLRSNFSSDKKPSFSNLIKPYGKEVLVDATVSRKVLKRFFSTTPEDIKDFYFSGALGSLHSGMIGLNAHFANGLAAIYIACGQDVAQVVNASIGISIMEIDEKGDLYLAAKLPNLIIGTVGGGTALPAQQECLKMMGCYGNGKANKFAEIVAGTILAGDLAICASLANGNFIDAHKKKRTF